MPPDPSYEAKLREAGLLVESVLDGERIAAQRLLQEMLADGDTLVLDILRAARRSRIRPLSLATAKKDLGVVTSDYLKWVWSMQ